MDLIAQLQVRNSASKVTEPAPSPDELEQMFQAALRSPDHAWLAPWKFVTIEGDKRGELGELMARATKKRDPSKTEEDLDAIRSKAVRAPLIIAVAYKFVEHPKVPKQEQMLSAGCAAFSLLLAAESLGYAGIWRTGPNSFDPMVWEGLGLAENEELIGFLYIGTRLEAAKPLPYRLTDDFVESWDGLPS